MPQKSDNKRFAELEYFLQRYFDVAVAPVMKTVKDDLSAKQVKELADYQRSAAGILASANPYNVDAGWQTVRMTGLWNAKTAEDYLQMCNQRLQASKDIQSDFAVLAGEWRNAAVARIGRAKYDSLSGQIGGDLAFAYVGGRMEDLMVSKMVKDDMPKSSADYIIRRAAKQSIWNMTNAMMQSPLEAEIEARGEKAFRPSKTEKTAGTVIGSVADAASLGGAGSWKSLVTFVGGDLLLTGMLKDTTANAFEQKAKTMDVGISKGVFGSNADVFPSLRNQAKNVKPDDDYVQTVSDKLKKKIYYKSPFTMSWNNLTTTNTPLFTPQFTLPTENRRDDPKYKDVPLIVAPGKEDDYLEAKAKADAEKQRREQATQEKPESETQGVTAEGQPLPEQSTEMQAEGQGEGMEQIGQTNENGWNGLLANFGLDGFSDIGKNLGYVLSMLPDMLVGLFTGKTKSLNMDNSLLPLAAIVAGMFVKNPMLKMLLIGMGGANLVNKVGHEALSRKQNEGVGRNMGGQEWTATQYRRYADEPLSPRMENPVLQGTCLIANIDHVPCTIQLPQTVVAAHQAGALPLNTLANAVLAKYDQGGNMSIVAARNYERSEEQREAVQRTRGV